MSRVRRLGYRLLGPRLDYLLHLRPAEWPLVALHTATGALLGAGFPAFADGDLRPRVLAGIALWVLCLNAGTLAINSAVDRDAGDVAYLRNPPPPPRRLLGFGLGLMALGAGCSVLLPSAFAAAYGVCAVLSLLYSLPPARLKAIAGADWLVNTVGFGFLTPYAGWATTGTPLRPNGVILLSAFALLFGALYPLTQLYQLEEDRRRGDRTLVSVLGVRWGVRAAMLLCLVAFAGFFASRPDPAAALGGAPWAARLVLGGALMMWLAVLLPWASRAGEMLAIDHQRGLRRALVAWAVTDLAAVLVWASCSEVLARP